MTCFPKPQQPYYQQQPQFVQQPYVAPMTPFVPPSREIPTIPQPQSYQPPPQPFQPPIIPQYIPQVSPTAAQIPNAQPIVQYQPAQQLKMPPPQPKRPSPITSNYTNANKERYAWSQKKEKMPWGIADSIDLDQIVRRGDLKSVLFYMNQFVNATITKEDLKKFGTKGALNAFLILQLGTEYLLNECHRLETEIEEENPANEQANIDLVNQFNEKIDTFNAELQKRENLISQLKKQNNELKSRLERIKNARSAKEKKQNKKNRHHFTIDSQTNTQNDKKFVSVTSGSEESGLLHDETEIKKLKRYDQDSNILNSKNKHKNKKNKEQLDDSKSLGEIDPEEISQNVIPFLPDYENSPGEYENSGITDYENSGTAEIEEEDEEKTGEGDDY